MADETTSKKRFDAYMNGELASRLAKDKRADLAVAVMADAYYPQDNENPILALAFYEAMRARDGNEYGQTVVGQRTGIEAKRYSDSIAESTLETIVGSKIGTGVSRELKNTITDAYGSREYGASVKKANEFSTYQQHAMAQLQVDLTEAGDDQDTQEKAKKKAEDRMKELQDTYKDDLKVANTVATLEDGSFAQLKRDALLRSLYTEGLKIEDIEKLANA